MGNEFQEKMNIQGVEITVVSKGDEDDYISLTDDDYQGHFVIDIDVKADYCLRVKGDSMIGANIFDGDIVFITKSFDFETGEIYAVEMLDTSEASLKRVHKDGESLVLAPCNPEYTPTVTDYSEVRIAGKCVGVFHKYK